MFSQLKNYLLLILSKVDQLRIQLLGCPFVSMRMPFVELLIMKHRMDASDLCLSFLFLYPLWFFFSLSESHSDLSLCFVTCVSVDGSTSCSILARCWSLPNEKWERLRIDVYLILSMVCVDFLSTDLSIDSSSFTSLVIRMRESVFTAMVRRRKQ
jgi:hypothetical protein